MQSGEPSIVRIKVLHAAFVITIFLFVLVCRRSAPEERPIPNTTVLAFVLVASGDIAFGWARRRKLMRHSEEIFKIESNRPKALARWSMASIVSFVHAEMVALFGVAVKFLGANWSTAGGFFAAGLALLLLWTPRTPLWANAPLPPPVPNC